MTNAKAAETVRALLARAGVAVGGDRPWDISVANEDFYRRALDGGSAAGLAYADGWWDAVRLDEFFHRIFKAGLYERFALNPWVKLKLLAERVVRGLASDRGPIAGVYEGFGNDLFQAMLGKRMSYACACWTGARSLDEAEDSHLEAACGKLELKPGLSVLDLCCGWGAFAKYAAQRHGVSVVGVNISAEQVKLGRELCKGLPVVLSVQDYREIQGRFDRVVSIGSMQQAGPRNERAHMAAIARCLRPDGIALIHTLGQEAVACRRARWFDRGVFPAHVSAPLARLARVMEGRFVVEDVHNIGPHYDSTLLAWHDNLTRRWPVLRDKYGDRLYRALKFDLMASAGSFRARQSQAFQIVMTKPGRRMERFGEAR